MKNEKKKSDIQFRESNKMRCQGTNINSTKKIYKNNNHLKQWLEIVMKYVVHRVTKIYTFINTTYSPTKKHSVWSQNQITGYNKGWFTVVQMGLIVTPQNDPFHWQWYCTVLLNINLNIHWKQTKEYYFVHWSHRKAEGEHDQISKLYTAYKLPIKKRYPHYRFFFGLLNLNNINQYTMMTFNYKVYLLVLIGNNGFW